MTVSADSNTLWTAGFLNERFIGPVSPLGWSFIGALFEQIALREPLRYMGYPEAETIPATRVWQGHPYANVLIFQIIYNPFPAAFLPADTERYYPNGAVEMRKRAPYPRTILNPRFLISLFAHVLSDPFNVSPFNYWRWQRFVRRYDKQLDALTARLESARTPSEFLAVAEECYALDIQLLRIHRWSLTYADLFYKILAQWCGERAQPLISDVPNKTRAVNLDLQQLAEIAARLGQPLDVELLNNPAFAAALEPFLEKHGHRAFSLDLAQPTFRDDPTQLLPLLAANAVPSSASDLAHARAQAVKQLKAWQKPWFPALLWFARKYAALREDQRYYWHKSLALARRAYLQTADDLDARGALAQREDVFYATRGEIADLYNGGLAVSELRARVEQRRVEWTDYARRDQENGADAYPAFLQGDLPLGASVAAARAREWRGRGVSPGRARGVARVIRDPRELGRVAQGDILIAPCTDPAWTPVFARLAGLVLERGGVLSHAAVVAREYRVPAVAAVPNLTREIKDGEWIEVDGVNGIVRRVEK